MEEEIIRKVKQYEKRSWAMKVYAAFRWGKDLPCSLRFVVIPYMGCHYKCKYCYSWFKHGAVKQKENFRKALLHDIKRAKRFGLENLVVMVSSSTDCLQPIEEEKGDTLFALKELLDNGFSILMMTRNPKMLLKKEYLEVIKNPRLSIDVTIASLHENDPNSIFYGLVPTLSETLEAIKELVDRGKKIRIKVEPIVPSVGEVKGQTKEEFFELVRRFKEVGVSMIISKTMRLNEDVAPHIYSKFIDYYKINGNIQGITMTLSKKLREKLLMPLYEACNHYKMPLSTCVETDLDFPGTYKCSLNKNEIESSKWKKGVNSKILSQFIDGALSNKEKEKIINMKD